MLNKILIAISILWMSVSVMGQSTVSYVRDTGEKYNHETIAQASFTLRGDVNNGLENGVYWLKVADIQPSSIIQIPNDHIVAAEAYYNSRALSPKPRERFITFSVSEGPVYIRVEARREAYIPVTVQPKEQFEFIERKDLLFIGFYFGFVVVVIVLNLLYYQSFKDRTFLYYALFLLCVSYGLFIKDGAFFFFGFSERFILFNEVMIHVAAAVVCGYFSTSYLALDEHFGWLRLVRPILNFLMLVAGVLYLLTDRFLFFIIMDAIVFSVLTFYWGFGWLFVRKNVFTKLFAFAFLLILFSGVNFFVAQLFGFTIIEGVNAAHLNKAGGFVEMLMLSFGVFYRMRQLQNENQAMRTEILAYTNKIESLSAELAKNQKGDDNYFIRFDLSQRENEILTLITEGKSNKEIAECLFISVNTVKYHIKNIYQKMDISSRREALGLVQ